MYWIYATEFIGAFTLALLGLFAAKYILGSKPPSKVYTAAVSAAIVFITVWFVLEIGGESMLSPTSALMSHMKGGGKKTVWMTGTTIAVEVLGVLTAWFVFRMLGFSL